MTPIAPSFDWECPELRLSSPTMQAPADSSCRSSYGSARTPPICNARRRHVVAVGGTPAASPPRCTERAKAGVRAPIGPMWGNESRRFAFLRKWCHGQIPGWPWNSTKEHAAYLNLGIISATFSTTKTYSSTDCVLSSNRHINDVPRKACFVESSHDLNHRR
jgi:hypothetical protein